MNKNDKNETKPAKPLRTLGKDALRQVSGGLITETTFPKLGGGSKGD